MFIKIIFWITAFLILHTYVVYPVLVFILGLFSVNDRRASLTGDFSPAVSVLMAVHNEESVIREKIEALYSSDYPAEVVIGSDACTDGTDSILDEMKQKYSQLAIIRFPERLGKPGIINRLSETAAGEIFIITDANVIPEKDTIRKIVRNFADEDTGLTDSRLLNRGHKKDGISAPEAVYRNIESKLKHTEGKLWGKMMGPFGGFYAVRKSSYEPNSGNILADDFRICMNVIGRGQKAVSDPDAVVYEDVSNNLKEEFRRKVRISAGNFQNLKEFAWILLKPFTKWSFCFLSHKVLRWIAPFLWLIMIAFNIILAGSSIFYFSLLIVQVIFLILPAFDFILKKFSIHLVPLRFFTHLFLTNMALFVGFIRYLRGINSGVWTPTKRYQ